jgi:hypothetical protein
MTNSFQFHDLPEPSEFSTKLTTMLHDTYKRLYDKLDAHSPLPSDWYWRVATRTDFVGTDWVIVLTATPTKNPDFDDTGYRIPLATLPRLTYDELEELARAIEERIDKLDRSEARVMHQHAIIIDRSILTAVREAQYSIGPAPDDE